MLSDFYDRRFKVVYIAPTALLNCLVINAHIPGDCITKVSLLDVPDDTQVMHVEWSHLHCAWSVILYNAAWPICEFDISQIPTRHDTVTVNYSVPGSGQPLRAEPLFI